MRQIFLASGPAWRLMPVLLLIAMSGLVAAGNTETIFEPLPNGDFTQGLANWTTEASPPSALPTGTVVAENGTARLTKGGAFFVGLQQSFDAPEGLQALLLRITDEPVFSSSGSFIPEALEVHVTAASGFSAVSTWRPGTTATAGSVATGSGFSLGSGTTYVGGEFRIPLDTVPAGEQLTLVIALVGASADIVASAALDDVRLEIEQAINPPEPDVVLGCVLFRGGFESGQSVGTTFRCALGQIGDTGITQCSSGACPDGNAPGQDAEFGRDALAAADALEKLGSGPAGFDYTRIDPDGEILPDDAGGWSCVVDGHTGLMWEVKVNDPLDPGHFEHTYSWYQPDMLIDGGQPGVIDGGSCAGSTCDTDSLVTAINELRLCGASDWRLPTRAELMSLVNAGNTNPAISTGYFPLGSGETWTGTAVAIDSGAAWRVQFQDGSVGVAPKSSALRVRLVREVR